MSVEQVNFSVALKQIGELEKERDQLTKELDELRAHCLTLRDYNTSITARAEQAEAKGNRLKWVIENYAQHLHDCRLEPCTCGLTQALAETATEETK